MIIKSYQLEKLKQNDANFFLFYGENEGLKLEAINNLFKKNFSGKILKYEESEIIKNFEIFFNEISNRSLFEDEKLIIISRVSEKINSVIEEARLKKLEDIKVILNSGTLDKKSKLRSNFEKHKDLVCVPFYDDDKNILLNFANDFFQKKKLSVSREILNLLVERCRGDRFNLKNELIKIESYTKSRKQISGEEILNLTNLSENYSFSELADACLSKNKRKTVNIINENNFSSEDCIAIIRVFMNKAKRILSLMKMNEKNNNIEKNISMFKPPIFWKDKDVVREQVKHWSVQTIENFIFSINDTELLIKKNNNISVNLLNDFILSQFEANN
tara:strand:+ start:3288 stop:4280 length:993 start_codon:yes stop_codon:yes gene_type:complete